MRGGLLFFHGWILSDLSRITLRVQEPLRGELRSYNSAPYWIFAQLIARLQRRVNVRKTYGRAPVRKTYGQAPVGGRFIGRLGLNKSRK